MIISIIVDQDMLRILRVVWMWPPHEMLFSILPFN